MVQMGRRLSGRSGWLGRCRSCEDDRVYRRLAQRTPGCAEVTAIGKVKASEDGQGGAFIEHKGADGAEPGKVHAGQAGSVLHLDPVERLDSATVVHIVL